MSYENVYTKSGIVIDTNKLRRKEERKLADGLIGAATEVVNSDLAPEHKADPIKSLDDIYSVSSYLIFNRRFRDNMLFIIGINFGLRVSDLRQLRFTHLINDNLTFKDSFAIWEKKTRNTRRRKMNRHITINDAVVEAVTLYLKHTEGVTLSDYLFRSESNNGKTENEPLSIKSIDRVLKGIADDLGLSVKMSTHTLRKTFCYHQMLISHNDSRKLLLLQKMLGHSSPAQTLDYIGITDEEIDAAYRELNLGSRKYNYLVNSGIFEKEEVVV